MNFRPGESYLHDEPEITELFLKHCPNGLHLKIGPEKPHPNFPGLDDNRTLVIFSWEREPFAEWIVRTFNAQAATPAPKEPTP